MFLFLAAAFNVVQQKAMLVFVKSFGCSMNLAEGAVLAGCLRRAGYELTDSPCSADIVILNTCAVKGPTEDRIIEYSRRIPVGKKLIVGGCLPIVNLERLEREVAYDAVVGPAAGKHIVELTRRVATGEKIFSVEQDLFDLQSLDLPRVEPSSAISIIPVSQGCLGSCAYCCVVAARGHLRSYSVEDVVKRTKEDLAAGFREFWITSQDTGCYGKDIGTNLAVLLRSISNIDGDFRIRVGMMTINHVMEILEELVEAFRNERVFRFIHLPLQSGDDFVLKRMRRQYCAKDFERTVSTFRAKFPEITVATDVICGFPGEDEKAFQQTLRLIEEVRPDIVNVSKFFARPKTAAAGMKKDLVPPQEIKKRSTQMSILARKLASENNQRWKGWTGEVLIDEAGKTPGFGVGRNNAYKPVAVKNTAKLIGHFANVKISKTFPTYLEGILTQ